MDQFRRKMKSRKSAHMKCHGIDLERLLGFILLFAFVHGIAEFRVHKHLLRRLLLRVVENLSAKRKTTTVWTN